MSEPTPPGGEVTSVTIYGRTYNLRGSGDADYLEQLAAIVDGRMREIAEATGTVDTLKVAILASLNLADENLKAELEGPTPPNVRLDKRLGRMVSLLDEALAE